MRFDSKSSIKLNFQISLLPNAILGIFGIRTEPELIHQVILQEGKFSLRRYEAHTELATVGSGTRKRSLNKSFNALFAYISGENDQSKKFAMTTPVLSRKKSDLEWELSFYMESSAESLPAPTGKKLQIRKIAAQTFAVISFSGNASSLTIENMIFALNQFITRKGVKVIGKPVIAQYDQPFAIPFLKRNEILTPVKWDNG